jgi:endonuclease/exonuclease/phosphatase family metal-dependent hydrolase
MAAHPFVVAPVPRVRRRAGTAIGPDAVRGRVAAAGRVQPQSLRATYPRSRAFARLSSIVSALSSTEVANQARALVVAGDLNHEPDAATTLLLTGRPARRSAPRAFRLPDQGDGHRLWNPRRAHRTARIACWWDGRAR